MTKRSSTVRVVLLVGLLGGIATACPPNAGTTTGCVSSKLDPGTRWARWDGEYGYGPHFRAYRDSSCSTPANRGAATLSSPVAAPPAGIASWYAATWGQILLNAESPEADAAALKCAALLGVAGHLNSGGTFVIDGHPEWFMTSVPAIFDMTAPNAAIPEDLWFCQVADTSNNYVQVLP